METTETETTNSCGQPNCTRTDFHDTHSIEYYINRVRELQDSTRDAISEKASLNQEYNDFKDKVREVARDTAVSMEWCIDGLNQRMRELGLREFDTLKPRFQLTFQVQVEVEMDADNAQDAVWRVTNQLGELINFEVDEDDEDNIALNSYEIVSRSISYDRVDD